MDSAEELIMRARYHGAVARRMHDTYLNFEDKRVFVGVIHELSRGVTCLVRAGLLFSGREPREEEWNMGVFRREVGPSFLEEKILFNLISVFDIEQLWKQSAIEFSSRGTLILCIKGQWKFLNYSRLKTLIESVCEAVRLGESYFRLT